MSGFRSVKQEVQETLALRKDLAVWLASRRAEEWLTGLMTFVGTEQGRPDIAGSLYGAVRVIATTLRDATPYFVEEELVEVADAAARHATFPGYSFSPSEMPSPTGFISLAKPVMLEAHAPEDGRPVMLPISGFFWDGTTSAKHGKPKLVVWTLVPPAATGADEETIRSYPRIFMTGHCVVPFEADGWTDPVDTPDEEMRVLKTLWLLMGQQLTEAKKVRGPKHEQEKAEKKGRPIPEVTVVTLRRMSTTADYEREGHSHREYSHRFIVGGHWRKYSAERYSERVRSTPQWISPYVKGDPHKPLKMKDKVYRLAR